ncbi:MAG: hypothetical protein Q8P42_01690, partial [Gallionella sp.]|nr:hypothetical protein [Gallionella sp.]
TTPVFTLFQLEVESAKNTEKMLAFEQSIYETRPRFIKGTFTISASLIQLRHKALKGVLQR